jgi:hypothetical protein
MAVTIEAAQRLFSPEGAYLDTATYGLPPRTAFDAFQAARRRPRAGGAEPVEHVRPARVDGVALVGEAELLHHAA